MKKTILTLSALFFLASIPALAQDDKKKETQKKETKQETKTATEEKGGTRMAINEKGVPNKKKNVNNSNAKTTNPEGTKTGDAKK